jgi:hypothetical protein
MQDTNTPTQITLRSIENQFRPAPRPLFADLTQTWLAGVFRENRNEDDDDDPPPCPAIIAPCPRLPPSGAEVELLAA